MGKVVHNTKTSLREEAKVFLPQIKELYPVVKNDDLDWMDPSLFFKSLSKNYENLFREVLRLKIEAWNEGDPVIGLKANRLLNEWGSYYRKMRKKL